MGAVEDSVLSDNSSSSSNPLSSKVLFLAVVVKLPPPLEHLVRISHRYRFASLSLNIGAKPGIFGNTQTTTTQPSAFGSFGTPQQQQQQQQQQQPQGQQPSVFGGGSLFGQQQQTQPQQGTQSGPSSTVLSLVI